METHITPYHICLCLNFLSKIFISSPKWEAQSDSRCHNCSIT
jgi:hypothetical protein